MKLHLGDCIEVMRGMPENSVDAVVTDPPAGIGMMGKEWDDFRRSRNTSDAGRNNVFGRTSRCGPEYGRNRPVAGASLDEHTQRSREAFIAFMTDAMRECLRVLKPGGHALVWAIPRTSHWTATAIEDAGFEIRDRVSHLFGSGFPKSKNLAGGFGTALKPAVEDWWLCRKPIAESTVEKNVAKHGTGALNIDGCRIDLKGDYKCGPNGRPSQTGLGDNYDASKANKHSPVGRWPANLVLSHHPDCVEVGQRTIKGDPRGDCDGKRPGGFADIGAESGDGEPNARVYGDEVVPVYQCHPDCAVRLLDEQSGTRTSGKMKSGQKRVASQGNGGYQGGFPDEATASDTYGDSGGASRFFYCSKASRRDRGEGNSHPTVKPHELMKWIVRLTSTPTGGVVLDPFMGSGSTALACVAEGRDFIGIEREPEYFAIAEQRIAAAKTKRDEEAGLFAAA